MTSAKPSAAKPSQITDEFWVQVEMTNQPPYDESYGGKWQVFIDRAYVDEAWTNIAALVFAGELGPSAKVSTARPNPNAVGGTDTHVVIAYAQDWRDLTDLRRILRKLREIGLGQGWVYFKRDRETRDGVYTVRGYKGVSVWSAPPGIDEITTKWITGERLTVTDENEADVVRVITSKDAPLPSLATSYGPEVASYSSDLEKNMDYEDYDSWTVAEGRDTPGDVLAQLAEDESEEIRRAVAWNRNTPPEVLAQLAADKSKQVRGSVVWNRNTEPSP